jgi:hypothetical protein
MVTVHMDSGKLCATLMLKTAVVVAHPKVDPIVCENGEFYVKPISAMKAPVVPGLALFEAHWHFLAILIARSGCV